MGKQIFRKDMPNEFLFELFDKICSKTDKYYLVDLIAYKKMVYHNYHIDFCDQLMEFYHTSKQFYVTRKMTFNSFVNIIRQICKHNNIMYTSQIKYNESTYSIDYFVYFSDVSIIA